MATDTELKTRADIILRDHIMPNNCEGQPDWCRTIANEYIAHPKKCCMGRLKNQFIRRILDFIKFT